ncbi:TonB-dependent receptor [Aestuariibacter halophilus]|uniref:TonB-dependent receptor n=1 Tax=Fluctibacter halophilus TaxID=226011 RepID=A0ABS8GBF1_9ALTE|nr:TonB-dependent receptor [Aestuariibacter halophilus]MCC2617733.1 TonB-dependent receptor [Aestuariibacter halophilus]
MFLSLFSAVGNAQQNTELEQITVTTRQPGIAVKDTSFALSLLSKDAIQQTGHQHMQQLVTRVPGAWVSRGNGQEHLTAIRSPVLTGAGSCGAFLIAEDGVSLRANGFCNANQLFDANTEQATGIDVLRGPASVLYGSNAQHGVINVLTPQPRSEQGHDFTLRAGPHVYRHATLASRWHTQHASTGIYINGTSDNGYQADSGFDQQKATLVHQHESAGWDSKTTFTATNLNQETAGFVQGKDAYRDPVLRRSNPNPEAFRDAQSVRIASHWRSTDSEQSRWQITPYLRWNQMTFLQHYLPWQATESNHHRSIGVQLARFHQSEDVQWQWGVDSEWTEGGLKETQAEPFSPTVPAGSHYDYTVISRQMAPYLRGELALSDRWHMGAGVRYDWLEYDYRNHLPDGDACAPDINGCRFTRPASQSKSYGQTSVRAFARYQLDNDGQLYTSVSQGFRAPQATELFRLQGGQTTADLKTELLRSVDVGWRSPVGQGWIDLSVYLATKSRVIFQDSERRQVNDGATRHQGVELQLEQPINAQWRVSVAATLARHTYRDDYAFSNGDVKGNDIDTAPRHMGRVGLKWRPDEQLAVNLEWVHMGDYYTDPQNSARYAGHDLLNLRARWQLDDAWTVTLQALNLTDSAYAERADYAFGNERYFIGEPRSVYLGIQRHWQ